MGNWYIYSPITVNFLFEAVLCTSYTAYCCKAWKDPGCSAINCENWARRGECDRNPLYMINMCPDHCAGLVTCECGECYPHMSRDAIPIQQPAQRPELKRLEFNERSSACICGEQE